MDMDMDAFGQSNCTKIGRKGWIPQVDSPCGFTKISIKTSFVNMQNPVKLLTTFHFVRNSTHFECQWNVFLQICYI